VRGIGAACEGRTIPTYPPFISGIGTFAHRLGTNVLDAFEGERPDSGRDQKPVRVSAVTATPPLRERPFRLSPEAFRMNSFAFGWLYSSVGMICR